MVVALLAQRKERICRAVAAVVPQVVALAALAQLTRTLAAAPSRLLCGVLPKRGVVVGRLKAYI